MFESAELDHDISKAVYRREEAKLRQALLDAQNELRQSGRFAVLILIAGVEGAGKGETVNLLNEWMDPRFIEARAFSVPSDEEAERPHMWRFWRALPSRGRIGIFFGAWHTQPIVDRVMGRIKAGEYDRHISEILRIEKMLCDEGVLLLKFWFHLSKKQQKKRLKQLARDPKTSWRVTDRDWKLLDRYDDYAEVCEPFIRRTSTAEAPWMPVPGADPQYRSLAVGRTLLAAMRERLDDKPVRRLPDKTLPLLPALDRLNVIRALELDQPMTKEEYRKEFEKWQGRLNLLSRHPRFDEISVVAVFEGNDAAGKGGAIRRVTRSIDARSYHTVSVAAPTEEERGQPYLWRFWRHLPRRRIVTIFDRSWYGRVLVERVERLARPEEWTRAYAEINEFEQQLVEHGVVLVKFWIHISPEEQLARFRERERVEWKKHKITEEDWRNREKWSQYAVAVDEMCARTSTEHAPWTLIAGNDKRHARVSILDTFVERLKDALGD
jgi:polyphosphate:AMP phosphotransferase